MMKIKAIEEAEQIMEDKILTLSYFNRRFYDENKKTLKYIVVNKNPYHKAKNLPIFFIDRKKYDGKMANTIMKPIDLQTMSGTTACYYDNSNTIYVINGCVEPEVILHELCHVASSNSTTNNNKVSYSGFRMRSARNNYIGEAFDEGVTEWLVQKTLHGTDTNNDSYAFETRMARLLCMAVGDEVMYKSYSEANYKQLRRAIKLIPACATLKGLFVRMDHLQEAEDFGFESIYEDDAPAELLAAETKKMTASLVKSFNMIQRRIIDIYFSNRIKKANEAEINEFVNLLVTKRVDNEYLLDQYYYAIENNHDALSYFLRKLESFDKKKAKTLVKSYKLIGTQE